MNWASTISNPKLSDADKYSIIRQKAEVIEQKASLEENF